MPTIQLSSRLRSASAPQRVSLSLRAHRLKSGQPDGNIDIDIGGQDNEEIKLTVDAVILFFNVVCDFYLNNKVWSELSGSYQISCFVFSLFNIYLCHKLIKMLLVCRK